MYTHAYIHTHTYTYAYTYTGKHILEYKTHIHIYILKNSN